MKTIPTIVLVLLATIAFACGPDQRIIDSAKERDAANVPGAANSNVAPSESSFEKDLTAMRNAQSDGTVTQKREFVYDSLSRLIRERQVEANPTLDIYGVKGAVDPNKWTGVYTYTPDSLLDYGVDARGVKTKFQYDGLNRIKKVEYLGETTGFTTPTVDYSYDEIRTDPVLGTFYNKGRLTTVSTQGISATGQFTPQTIQKYDYDRVGQVVNHTQTIDQQTYNLQYGYNLAGQLVSEKYPSGRTVNMTVDNFGVTQTIADAQRTYVSGVTATYSSTGMTSQITLGNGTVESFTMNERLQFTSQSLTRGSEVVQKFDYAYGQIDGAGNLDTAKNNGQLARIEAYIGAAKQRTQKFSYDSIGRLAKSEEYRGDTGALTYKQVFDFDRFGNLYRKSASNPTTGQQNPIPFTPIEDSDINRSKNQLGGGISYDDAGQVTQDNKFREIGFGYDANGRVVKATKANTPDATTVYDALGNRVAAKVNEVWQYVIYDAFGQLVAEYGAPSEGMGGVKYVQQDHQGSVRTVTNTNGFVVLRTDHQAFGELIGAGVGMRNAVQGYGGDPSTRQSYGLTESDESSGQQHTWFRKLETQAGRWSSPDPYGGSMSLSDPQSFNRYAYVNNQPSNYVDPNGLQAMICMIDGMQANCSTAFAFASHGPARISNGEGSVSVTSVLCRSPGDCWDAGGASYTYIFNIVSYIQGSQGLIHDRGRLRIGGDGGFGVLDGVQVALDVCGLVPGLGEIADGANALISLGRGDYVGAGLSAAAMIPIAGWGAAGAKFGRTGQKLLKAAQPSTLENGIQLSGHAVERLAGRESHVTGSMIETALRRGEKYWDPKNQSNNYILENGFASGGSLLVGQNPNTGLVTTVISGKKNLVRPRMKKCN